MALTISMVARFLRIEMISFAIPTILKLSHLMGVVSYIKWWKNAVKHLHNSRYSELLLVPG